MLHDVHSVQQNSYKADLKNGEGWHCWPSIELLMKLDKPYHFDLSGAKPYCLTFINLLPVRYPLLLLNAILGVLLYWSRDRPNN